MIVKSYKSVQSKESNVHFVLKISCKLTKAQYLKNSILVLEKSRRRNKSKSVELVDFNKIKRSKKLEKITC
jgi:hypothetical protein